MPTKIAVFLLVLLVGLSASWAEEGRTPIFEPAFLDGAAGDISARYVVTRDIVEPGTGNVIVVLGTGVERVDIDLNGFALEASNDTGGGDIPVVYAEGLAELAVRNGALIGHATRTALYCFDCGTVRIEDLAIGTVNTGIWLVAPNSFSVRRNVVDTAAGHGIEISGDVATTTSGTLEDNLVQNAEENGIFIHTEINGVTIRRNRVRNAGLANGGEKHGITVVTTGPTEIRRNTVTQVLGYGIVAVVDGCTIADNLVEGAGFDGVIVGSATGVSSNCRINGNSLVDNAFNGLRVDRDGNQVDRNVMNDNGTNGLFFNTDADNNSYRANIIVGNVSSCISDLGTGNTSIADNLLADSPAGCP